MWFPRVTLQMFAWIGRGGAIAWPPRSPDLTALDFSVWEDVKDRVSAPLLASSLEELRTRVTEGCDRRCGHDTYDLGRNRWQVGHVSCDTCKPR